MNHIGIDVGGTKIAAGKVENGNITQFLRVETQSQASQDDVIAQITDLIDELIDTDTVSIGVAVPAIVENGVIFETVNIPSWKKVPLQNILEEKYQRPVYIENDANCFALGEKYAGAGAHIEDLVALTISTGLGAGIIIHNKLHTGHNGGAGEFGEIIFKDQTIDYYCSGSYFVHEHNTRGEQLAARAAEQDKQALEIFNQFGTHVGKALAMVVHSIDPEMIVLGGSVMASYPYFKTAMMQSLKDAIYDKSFSHLTITVSKTKHVVLLGAASLDLNAQ